MISFLISSIWKDLIKALSMTTRNLLIDLCKQLDNGKNFKYTKNWLKNSFASNDRQFGSYA